jgi:hypothetical protein
MAMGWFHHLAGHGVEAVRPIRDEIGQRVRSLLASLDVNVS